MSLLKYLWSKWKAFAELFSGFMSRLILTVIYFTILLPYGLAVHFWADPLQIKFQKISSGWHPFSSGLENSLREFHKQY